MQSNLSTWIFDFLVNSTNKIIKKKVTCKFNSEFLVGSLGKKILLIYLYHLSKLFESPSKTNKT